MAFKPFNKEAAKQVQTIKEEMVKEPMKEEIKEVWEVVDKLPVQEIRKVRRDDGVVVNLITVAEYLTYQANAGSQ